MKKICPLILLLFLLAGCSNFSNNSIYKKNVNMKDIHITETKRCGIEWEKIQFPIDLNEDALKQIKPLKTNQGAAEVAKNIIEELHRAGKLSEYILTSITHSTEDDVWCFEYSINQQNEDVDNLIDGGSLYVAIDGNKGALIKAWIEE